MRNLIKIGIISGFLMLFTGCSLTTVNVFNEKQISFKMNENTKKIKILKVNVNSEEFEITKHPRSFLGKARSMKLTSTFNKNVLRAFMLSNFDNVNFSKNKNSDIYINSKIEDFDYSNLISGGIELNLENEMSIYKKNKLIFKKKYNETIVETGKLMSTKLEPNEFVSEVTTVALFRFYDEIFKPDLIKALKENK